MGAAEQKLIDEWLAGKSENTAIAYTRELDEFRAEMRKPAISATSDDVAEYLRRWESARERPASKRRRISALRSFFRFAQLRGAIDADPMPALSLSVPAAEPRPERLLSPEDVRRVIRACGRTSDQNLIRTLWIAGLTASEAAQLRREHVLDTEPGSIALPDRTIYIPYTLASALRHGYRRRRRLRDGELLEQITLPTLFPTSRQIQRRVQRAGDRAGIPDLLPRDLRAAHRRHALELGCPIGMVVATLGDRLPATPWGEQLRSVGTAQRGSSALYLAQYDIA